MAHPYRAWSSLVWRGLVVAVMVAAAGNADATILFSDAFSYPTGDLAGNGGGTGWFAGSLWTGGAGVNGNLVASSLPGVDGSSIRVAPNGVTSRFLSTIYTTGSSPYYISFVFNANPYDSVGFAGVSVFNSGSSVPSNPGDNLLIGMPGGSGELGFDWTNRGAPSHPATNNTNYLALVGITPGSGATTNVTMFVSTDLTISGTALAATTPWDSMTNEPGFVFDSVNFAGGYNSGSIGIAGLAMADNPAEAVAFTQSVVVPEPGSLLTAVAGVAMSLAAARRWRHRSGRS